MQTIFPCRWPTQPGRPGERRSEPLLDGWMDGWTDGSQNRQKWALAPQVFEIRIFGKKQALFWPIWATEKICQNFRPTKFSMRKPQNGRFSFRQNHCLCFFFGFSDPSGRFWGSKIEKFRFFFLGPKWVSGWFGGGLGSL